MLRQSSSRNQRSKGVRGKHILQICMLLAVCFWLIYQVKHSYDKRKHFEDVEISEKLPKFDKVVKLGRKDLHPRDKDLSTTHDKIDDEEVEDEDSGGKGDESFDETQEELERKRKEEGSADIEALIKGGHRDEEDEGGLVGDDEIDEQDKGEAEVDEDLIEGDKDVEKDEENETEEKDNDDDEHQQENDTSSDDQDHDRNTHETREENYKADDASSAVAHVVQTKLDERPEHINLNVELDVQEHRDMSNGTDVRKEQNLNTTNVLENSNEATPPRLEDVLIENDTSETVDSTLQSEEGQVLETTAERRNSTEDLSDDKISNITASSSINATEDRPISTSNTTDATPEHGGNSNSTMNQGFSAPDLVINFNLTTHFNKTDSLITDENKDVSEEKTDSEEDSILSSLNDDETLRDPLISEEEDKQRDNLLDLDTLPEIRTEGTDSDDAASEE